MPANQVKRILILCTGNSCRSQMMEAYLKSFLQDRAEVYSAGIESHGLNPWAELIMEEDGFDISKNTSDKIEKYEHLTFDTLITVCDHAKEVCPTLPGVREQIQQSFEDPAKAHGTEDDVMAVFRRVRDEIKAFALEYSARF